MSGSWKILSKLVATITGVIIVNIIITSISIVTWSSASLTSWISLTHLVRNESSFKNSRDLVWWACRVGTRLAIHAL